MKKEEVLNHFGSVTAIAEALTVTVSAISQWGDVIPEKQAYRIERHTKGALVVNPDLYKKAA